jgi:GTP diphosphokinase / guanosine-3',5'-bis(diphosphate) 3'-diphosphatase
MEVIGTDRTEIDKRLIMSAYRGLLKSVKVTLSPQDKKDIRKAYELAVESHKEQRRKSGEPYVLHPIAVAKICAAEIGLGATSIICALLHDVVEDTTVTLEDIERIFNPKVRKIVDGLTKLDKSYNSESPQAENFKKVLTTLGDDVRVVLIKMADRLHNMRTLGAMKRDKQLKIAAETNYIYAPLAHRLGLYAIKTEFQDLCMKITDPDTYKSISKGLKETKRNRESFIDTFIEKVKPALEERLPTFGMGDVNFKIFGRAKSIYSIWNKIKGKDIPLEEVYDLFAIRIILDVPLRKEKPACWMVYAIVNEIFHSVPERSKDWITQPKSNGYESLHCTMIGPDGRYIEVQIRTTRMDDIAERGLAAHWKYKGVSIRDKEDAHQPDVYEKWLVDVRELLETNSNADPIEFLQDFKTNLYSEDIFISTPRGDVIALPKGATGLDFAFAIHTDIGAKCNGVKVNGIIKSLNYELLNGDRVEIITYKHQKPSDSWLKFVKTGKARSRIRQLLKEDKKKQAADGKEILLRKLDHMKVPLEENIEFLIKNFGYKSRLDFYYAISLEQVDLKKIKRFKVEGGRLSEPELPKTERIATELADIGASKKFEEKPRLLINNQPGEQYEFSFATCCNPVANDEVFAYLTSTSGLKIHRITCPNAENLQANYSYRILPAQWVNTMGGSFVASVSILGIDTGIGVIERLSHNISSLGLNIRAFAIEGNEGHFEAKVKIVINNLDQLTLAIRALKKLDGVQSVVRLD